MSRRIFCDMDGVLADFDAHHEAVFGIRPSKADDDVDWAKVRAVHGFYQAIPPMPDMMQLWSGISHLEPTILTGVPSGVEEATHNKLAWVQKHLGDHVRVICCRSREKSLHMRPGDIIIDDWGKYRHLWEERGGIWILHTSAEASLRELSAMGVI